jgi:hypothetical protein
LIDSRARAALACGAVAYLIVAAFSGYVVLNHDYEAEYLALGDLVVRGQLSLYQDEMTGQWMPLPFYVFGISQLLFGPSLLAGRIEAILIGLAVVILTFRLAARWGGPLAGVAAAALLSTHGLVIGYFSTVDFSGLVALIHLLGLYILFRTQSPRRDLWAMLVFSTLSLAKPHYWPTVPFALAYLVWRPVSWSRRAALGLVAIAIPVLFLVSDPAHIKIFAYMPVLRDWVAPLGYHSWHTLIEDPEQVWVSDYAETPWSPSLLGRGAALTAALAFLFKRYALWMVALVAFTALARAGRARPAGFVLTACLFAYLVVCQFVIVGPYTKQAFAYVGAVAPLLAAVIGLLFARAAEQPSRQVLAVSVLAIVMIASPWVHRAHTMPRTVSMADATIPRMRALSNRLAALLPTGETRVFFIGDPLPVYLAGRRTYLRQFHQHNMVFTSVREPSRYQRSGLWGLAELEEWLGHDARYAVLQSKVLAFYRSRTPYREHMSRLDALLERNFTLVETVPALAGDSFLVYRRRAAGARRSDLPGQHDHT